MRGALVAVLCLAALAGTAQATEEPLDVERPVIVAELLRGAARNEAVKDAEVAGLKRENRKLGSRVRRLEAKLEKMLERKREAAERKRCRRPANIVVLGHCIQARGYDVGEHPAFGGVSPVHHGPCHYAGKALDVNDGAGESAAEMASLDRLAAWLRTLPRAWVLWRTVGHFNHLHVAYDCVG